jgi:NitT/TauT family transport system permease protein
MNRVALVRVIVVAGFVLLIEALCRFGIINHLTLLPPSEMAVALVKLLASGQITAPMVQTFSNVAIAFALSVIFGLGAGVVIHALPRVRRACDPLLASYYSVPVFVFYPLFVSLLGLNRWPLIAIGFAFAVTAMVIATLNGLDRVPPVLLKVARVHRMSRSAEIVHIILPAAAPYLFTGVKLALAYSFIGILAGEFILSGGGLGFAIAYAYEAFDNRTMYALMLFVLIVVIIINAALYTWEQRILDRRGRA